jgi:hypothetical protein
MIHHADSNGALYLDDALSPILVATFVGTSTVKLVDLFHQWCDEHDAICQREGRPLIMISDATRAGRPPADVRRAFAEHSFTGETRSYAVIDNPLIRGAMTAVGWLVGDKFDVISCKTLADAFELASEFARARGLQPPPASALTNYAVG